MPAIAAKDEERIVRENYRECDQTEVLLRRKCLIVCGAQLWNDSLLALGRLQSAVMTRDPFRRSTKREMHVSDTNTLSSSPTPTDISRAGRIHRACAFKKLSKHPQRLPRWQSSM